MAFETFALAEEIDDVEPEPGSQVQNDDDDSSRGKFGLLLRGMIRNGLAKRSMQEKSVNIKSSHSENPLEILLCTSVLIVPTGQFRCSSGS